MKDLSAKEAASLVRQFLDDGVAVTESELSALQTADGRQEPDESFSHLAPESVVSMLRLPEQE